MEYCAAGSVSDLIQANRSQPLDEDLIAYICKETLAGLAYLHSIGKVMGASSNFLWGKQILQGKWTCMVVRDDSSST